MFYFIINFNSYIIFILEILVPYLPPTPKCLELFARYLLPDWTSYGLEALKFQHQFLYENSDIEHCNYKSNIIPNENVKISIK